MTPEYEEQADAAERDVADMEERSERLGEHIDEARQDWEAKKVDPSVPGAAGDPDRAEEGGRHPEAAYPAKGSDEELGEEDAPGGEEEASGEERGAESGEEEASGEARGAESGEEEASGEERDAESGEEEAPGEERGAESDEQRA